MIFDFLTVGPFVGASLNAKPWLMVCIVVVAVIALETYSSLPFPVASIVLCLALLTMRRVLNIFDASSLSSCMITFLLVMCAYAAYGTAVQSFAAGSMNTEILIRGIIFLARTTIAGVFLGLSIYFIQYSISWIRYAFMEKKVI